MTENLGIKRVRYSYVNLYDFVLSKLQLISHEFLIQMPWQPVYHREIQLDKMNRNLEYESCAEYYVPLHHQIPCISEKDLKILKLDSRNELTYDNKIEKNNPACNCPSNKMEIMSNNNFKCEYDCKYCYWKSVKIDYARQVK